MFDTQIVKEALDGDRDRRKVESGSKTHDTDKKAILDGISKAPGMGEVLEDIRKVLTCTPDIRQVKVEEVKRQLESGTFAVDTRSLAEGILQETILEELL
jgi:anti-sigma28 factor (negative regulator of flagellin synthesis)